MLCFEIDRNRFVCSFIHFAQVAYLHTYTELFRFVFFFYFFYRRMLAINLKISIRLLSNYVKLYCIPFSFPLCLLLLLFFFSYFLCGLLHLAHMQMFWIHFFYCCCYCLLHQKESENNKPRLRKRDSFFFLVVLFVCVQNGTDITEIA